MPTAEDSPVAGVPPLVRRIGATCWYVLGVVALATVATTAFGAISGIAVPLVIAAILGIVLEPVSAALQRRGVPATVATALTLLGAVAVLAGTVAVVLRGFVGQLPEIHRQLVSGWNAFVAWGRELDIDAHWLEQARAAFDQYAPQLGQGVLGVIGSTFYGALSLIMGLFFALFFLFFVLRDGHAFPAWVARSTALDLSEVDEVVALCRSSVLGYFRGTAITAVVTAPIFMVPLVLLRVPLVVPIFVLYFFLSFVPFVGAWITGVFAVLIAFGTGGPTAAAIIGITFVISNGTIQSAVSSWALGSSLQLHPVSVLLATMIGGSVAGLLGMVLGAPVLAAVLKSVAAIRRARSGASDGAGSAEPDGAGKAEPDGAAGA